MKPEGATPAARLKQEVSEQQGNSSQGCAEAVHCKLISRRDFLLSEELTIQSDRKYQRGDLKGDLLSVTSLQNHSEKCKYTTFRASLIKSLNPGQSFSKYSILSPKTQILAVK
ncbi:unnamed protein product [Eretmochelys imbricata]